MPSLEESNAMPDPEPSFEQNKIVHPLFLQSMLVLEILREAVKADIRSEQHPLKEPLEAFKADIKSDLHHLREELREIL